VTEVSNKLEKRALGASGLQVSPIGFGLISLSGIYGASDDH
jgi:aryl-alcohol dehydrogenase-like predicted oxidoreductase